MPRRCSIPQQPRVVIGHPGRHLHDSSDAYHQGSIEVSRLAKYDATPLVHSPSRENRSGKRSAKKGAIVRDGPGRVKPLWSVANKELLPHDGPGWQGLRNILVEFAGDLVVILDGAQRIAAFRLVKRENDAHVGRRRRTRPGHPLEATDAIDALQLDY